MEGLITTAQGIYLYMHNSRQSFFLFNDGEAYEVKSTNIEDDGEDKT